jgi:hypothetical protein
MRLYLSSFDLGDRPEELLGLTGLARRAAIILNALDNRPEGRAVWLKEQTDKLVGLGFGVVELDLKSESVDREIAFYEATGIPYRTLRDGEALIIHDHREKIGGSREDR